MFNSHYTYFIFFEVNCKNGTIFRDSLEFVNKAH